MKTIALFLNHFKLGGAEKSALEQAGFLDQATVDLYYPQSKEEKLEISKDQRKSFDELKPFEFHSSLLEVSRGNLWSKIRGIFGYIISFPKIYALNFTSYDILWLNGMKVFVYLLPALALKSYKGEIYFHLRDYIPKSHAISIALWLARRFDIDLRVIANSNSVAEDFKKNYRIEGYKIHVCYNPCHSTPKNQSEKSTPKTLGVCSMLTPWKGIHVVVLFANLYEKELRELGINKVQIFGSNIYSTKGEHIDYEDSLQQLNNKLGGSLISFQGLAEESEMYKEIDILIHSSLEREPFGRVIVEAYGRGIPVISTGLGGAAEILIEDRDLRYQKHSYEDLYYSIRKLSSSSQYFEETVQEGRVEAEKVNLLAKTQIREVFEK